MSTNYNSISIRVSSLPISMTFFRHSSSAIGLFCIGLEFEKHFLNEETLFRLDSMHSWHEGVLVALDNNGSHVFANVWNIGKQGNYPTARAAIKN